MNLLEHIKDEYPKMSKGQKRIAEFILENYDKAAFSTAAKMGQAIGVSESTVVRFAYAMGFSGYPELQASLQELIRNKLTSIQRLNLMQNLSDEEMLKAVFKSDVNNIRKMAESLTIDDFNEMIEKLLKARTVYVLGLRSSLPLAQVLHYYLNFVLDDVRMIGGMASDVFEQMVRISEEDVFIGISFPRYSRRTVDAMRYAKSAGTYTVALTDSAVSPIYELADKPLIARSDMASFADSLVAPLSLINAIITVLSRKNPKAVTEHLTHLEDLWHSQGIYIDENERQNYLQNEEERQEE